MSNYTMEQVLASLKVAQDRIKSGKLADVASNGQLISSYIKENNLEPTADNFYAAINALAGSLKWTVLPKALVADQLNKANVQILPDQRKDEKARADLKAATEAAEAKATADAKTFARIDAAINSLYLRRLSETADQKARLQRYVAQEKARPAIPETIFEQVRKEIERLYREEERLAERM
jgi:hypothetical protein